MVHIQIAEARVRAVPAQTDNARLAVAVFGYDALGLILIGLVFLAVLGIVVGRAVEEQHDVGILLDRAGVTQVGKLGPVIRAARRLSAARDSWEAR